MKPLLATLTISIAMLLAPSIAEAGNCSAFFAAPQVQQQHVQAFAVPQYQAQAFQQPVILQQRSYAIQQPVILRQQFNRHAIQRVQVQRVQAVRQRQVIVNRGGFLGRRAQVIVR